jgi:hypothetical protein
MEPQAMSVNAAPPRRCCSHVSSCELFPKFGMRGSLKVWTAFFCEGHFETCERYKLALQGHPVPANLLPNGKVLNLDLAVEPRP